MVGGVCLNGDQFARVEVDNDWRFGEGLLQFFKRYLLLGAPSKLGVLASQAGKWRSNL